MFPDASQATIEANPSFGAPLSPPANKNAVQGNVVRSRGKRGVMNKTEAEFALILEAMKRKGEILRYEYEGATLHWAGMRYTPDFVVFSDSDNPRPKLIEVKGGHIWDRDIVRFKGVRAYWPEFTFEMHQKKKGEWKQIL